MAQCSPLRTLVTAGVNEAVKDSLKSPTEDAQQRLTAISLILER